MEMKNKRFSYKDIIYKGKRLTALAFILLLGGGLMLTSADQNEIPVHDGDVLVDSLSISEESEAAAEGGTFEERRAALELERNKLIAALDSTINSSTKESEVSAASAEKDRILSSMEDELTIENLIASKNLPPSFVLVTENSVNVTVDKQELDTNTVAKICDIVMRETGRGADKIIVQSMY